MKPAHIIAPPAACSALVAASLSLAACSGPDSKQTSGQTIVAQTDSYHADLDIAMTVRSIVDAIQVGEPLTDDDYSFRGVFTDGIGSPLYTDIQGAPGEWKVDVTSSSSACISNLRVGDLLADDLRDYLAANLNLDDTRIVELMEDEKSETETATYDFGAGYMKFIIRDTITADYEGVMLDILLNAKQHMQVSAEKGS